MGNAGSAAALFPPGADRCGIYVLEFATGERYVGQTIDMPSRYASHLRRHGDIAALRFAPCARDDLDRYERHTIARQQREASLRNLALTSWPGGVGDFGVEVSDGLQIELPWDRSRRGVASPPSGPTVASSRQEAALAELAGHAWGERVLEAAAAYVAAVIPSASATAGVRWTATAMPATNRRGSHRRLLTLSCGAIETLYVMTDARPPETTLVVNIDSALAAEYRRPLGRFGPTREMSRAAHVGAAEYRAAEGVLAVRLRSPDALARWLAWDPFADAAYRLNVRLMRQGNAMFRRFHNPALSAQLLSRAAARATGGR